MSIAAVARGSEAFHSQAPPRQSFTNVSRSVLTLLGRASRQSSGHGTKLLHGMWSAQMGGKPPINPFGPLFGNPWYTKSWDLKMTIEIRQ